MTEPTETIPSTATPLDLNAILADLQGFGVEEFEELLTLEISGKKLQIKLSNITTQDDLTAMLAVDGARDYAWFQGVKLEILSRSISWINGYNIRSLKGADRIVSDPTTGFPSDIQVVMRNLVTSWGLEVMQCLWKVLMNFTQTIENRLIDSFPEAAIMTNVELRYRERVEKELEETTSNVIRQRVEELLSGDDDGDADVPLVDEEETS